MMKSFRGFYLLIALFLLSAINILGCSCSSLNVAGDIDEADYILVGEIIKEIKPNRQCQFEVSKVLKGNVTEKVKINATGIGSSCEISDYKLNNSYLLLRKRS